LSDLQGTIRRGERPEVAVSRRSGDEIRPWLLNGDFRPIPLIPPWAMNVRF
jgi:hypothetical protein